MLGPEPTYKENTRVPPPPPPPRGPKGLVWSKGLKAELIRRITTTITGTVVLTKSDSDLILCLQLLSIKH